MPVIIQADVEDDADVEAEDDADVEAEDSSDVEAEDSSGVEAEDSSGVEVDDEVCVQQASVDVEAQVEIARNAPATIPEEESVHGNRVLPPVPVSSR